MEDLFVSFSKKIVTLLSVRALILEIQTVRRLSHDESCRQTM